MKYGYDRVSTKDKNIDRQIDAMNTCGENLDRVYINKSSGKGFKKCLSRNDE